MEEKEEKAPKFTMLQLSNRCWTRHRSIIECSLCCDCLSDLTFCASYLICFLSAKELYAGHKWPTSTLNEYSVLIAERRHPGSRHEICARTRDHWDNSPCPDHGFSVHSPPLRSTQGLEWLISRTDGKLRPLYLMTVQGVGQSLMGEMGMNKISHPASFLRFFAFVFSIM